MLFQGLHGSDANRKFFADFNNRVFLQRRLLRETTRKLSINPALQSTWAERWLLAVSGGRDVVAVRFLEPPDDAPPEPPQRVYLPGTGTPLLFDRPGNRIDGAPPSLGSCAI